MAKNKARQVKEWGIPGVSICMSCRLRLRVDRERGERVCGNPQCEKYVAGAEALPEC